MANVFDYLDWRGDLPFSAAPFSPPDNLILCCLSYVHFGGIVGGVGEEPVSLAHAAELFAASGEEKERVRVPSDGELLKKAAKTRRFADLRLCRYVSRLDFEEEKQFAAVTFLLPDGSVYAAFRGTDSTLVGWKEDLNMSFLESVPAQEDALAYLKDTAVRCPGPLRTGGHSKGGNLAVYAASLAPQAVQDRLLAVYNNDGPGFSGDLLRRPGSRRIADRVHTFVPQSSIVGMLLEHDEDYLVIRSSGAGPMQHDPYSWEILGPDFVRLESVTQGSRLVDRTLKDWLAELEPGDRRGFIDSLYEILSSTNAVSLGDLSTGRLKNALAMLEASNRLSREEKARLSHALSLLLASAGKNLLSALPGQSAGRLP